MRRKVFEGIPPRTGVNIPKTHKLLDLLALCCNIDEAVMILQADLVRLEGYSIIFRYPGQSADKTEARHAFRAAQAVNDFMAAKLGYSQLKQ